MKKVKATSDSGPATHSTPKPYEPTPRERVALERIADRLTSAAPSPKFTVSYAANVARLEGDHVDQHMATALLADALGTGDLAFASAVLDQLSHIACKGDRLTARDLNAVLAMVRGIGPRDPTEALLAAQMVAVHNASVVAAIWLSRAETIVQQDSASNMLTKLTRTFTSQVETLKKYRSTGEQKVTVQHQHVSVTAGQAIVGVRQGGGTHHETASQSHAPGTHASADRADAGGPALLGHEQALPVPMPRAGDDGKESLPHARGEGGRAHR